MGRKKINEESKKIKIGVTVEPNLVSFYKEKSINLSSLVNKLLKMYKENEFEKEH